MTTQYTVEYQGVQMTLEGPDNATPDQIRSAAQQRYQTEIAPQARQIDEMYAYSPAERSADRRREQVASGMTLRVGPLDTGVPLPQPMAEGLAGMGRRMTEIGSLGTADRQPAADELLDESNAALAGSILTDVGAMAAGGAGLSAAARGAAAAPRVANAMNYVAQGLTRPGSVAQAATAGGLYGAATTDERLGSGLAGAFGGALGQGVPTAAAKVVKPALTRGAQSLREAGVRLTPGEMLGGIVQRLEDGATSVPLIGDFVRNAKRMSLEDFNRVLVDDSLKQIGGRLDDTIPAGREAIRYADNAVSQAYDDVLSGLTVRNDAALDATVTAIRDMSKSLPMRARNIVKREFDEQFAQIFDNPTRTALGPDFKGMLSSLRTEYGKLQRSGNYYQRKAGDALREIHRQMMDAAKRQNPEAAARLEAADRAYAILSRVKGAASRAGADGGIVTPAQVLAEVRKTGPRGSFARGEAMGQELAEAAKETLPSTVPDSGTPFRGLLLGSPLLAGPAEAAGVDMAAPALIGAGVLGGLYTRPGQAVLRGAIGARPSMAAPLRRGLLEMAPYSGIVGSSAYINQQ